MKEITNETITNLIWHWKVEDGLDWKFCSNRLSLDENISISPNRLMNKLQNYFIELAGIAPYTKCPKCGNELIPKEGRYSRFVGCSSYPDCDFAAGPANKGAKDATRNFLNEIGRDSLTECPKCGGDLILRMSIRGKLVGCSSYPNCGFIALPKRKRRSKEEIQKEKEEISNKFLAETGYAPYTDCPLCGKKLVPRNGRFGTFVGCSGYPDCRFIASSLAEQQEALQNLKESTGYEPDMNCPDCGGKLQLRRSRLGFLLGCSNYPECQFVACPQKENHI